MRFSTDMGSWACGGEHVHEGVLKVIDIVVRGVKVAGFLVCDGDAK